MSFVLFTRYHPHQVEVRASSASLSLSSIAFSTCFSFHFQYCKVNDSALQPKALNSGHPYRALYISIEHPYLVEVPSQVGQPTGTVCAFPGAYLDAQISIIPPNRYMGYYFGYSGGPGRD